jgi:arylsulfatase A-like enzyme
MIRCAIAAVLLASWLALSAHAGERPNVLMIAVDDLRPEMTCYGAERMVTPNFDRLARRGARFARAYCNIAVCGASRASLLTGLRPTPDRFTSYRTWAKRDAPDVVSLPRLFRQHGYHTVSNGKVYHHRTDDPEAWSEAPWRPKTGSIWWALEKNRTMTDAQGKPRRGPAYEAVDLPDARYPDHQIADKTIQDLRRLADGDQPFFLACGFYRPHLPFVAPKKYWELYPADEVRLPDNMFFPRDLGPAFRYTWGEMRAYVGIPSRGPVSEATARDLIRGYHASVSFVDAQIGRLLDELDRLKLADDTIVILWGDHGWQLGEHGMWCKHTNFEVAVRTPLLVVAPGAPAGQVREQLVEYVDIYPTLCELADLPPPDHLQGKSFAPLLTDADAPHKTAVFSRHGRGDSVKTDRYRYTEVRADGGRGKLLGQALFDHQQDPGENQNLANDPAHADILRRHAELLRESRP